MKGMLLLEKYPGFFTDSTKYYAATYKSLDNLITMLGNCKLHRAYSYFFVVINIQYNAVREDKVFAVSYYIFYKLITMQEKWQLL